MSSLDVIGTAFNANMNSRAAANPFHSSSTLQIANGYSGRCNFSLSWKINGYPGAGTVVFSGNCSAKTDLPSVDFELVMHLEQGNLKVEKTFVGRSNETIRYGLLFDSDGSPFTIGFRVKAGTTDDFTIELHPIESHPIVLAPKSAFVRLLDNQGPCMVSCNQGGLMNRLIPLMSLMKIGRIHKRSICCVWSANNHCAAQFNDLFDLGDSESSDFDAGNFKTYQNYTDVAAAGPYDLSSQSDVLMHTITPIETINPSVLTNLLDVADEFRKMPLARGVLSKLAAFDGLEFANVIGFHIRRPYPGNAFAEQEKAKFTLGIDVFIDLIYNLKASLPEYKSVLVCTNDLLVEEEIKRIFGDYVITFNKSSIDNTTDFTAVQEALIDLILLSRCPLMFSQETTAFGTIAHVLGRNKLFSVTRQTDEKTFNFWGWTDGMHVTNLYSPRNDISKLVDLLRSN